MKLYKIDFTNTIGDYMVTVPTDSQFLLGISNGDSDAEVELLEGETEITPEDEKIGAYTVFKFETDGTPFRKHLKANINGQKPVTKYWDAHEYDITDGTLTGTMAILDDDVFAIYNPEAPTHPIAPTATEMTVKFKDASGNYSTTLVYTFNAVAQAGGLPSSIWDAPTEIDESITSVIPVPKKIRLKNAPLIGWGWNKIEPNYTGQSSTVNWKATPLVADIQIPYEDYEPYTDKLNIVVKCDKMSVAYRDFEGGGEGGSGNLQPMVVDSTTSVVQVTPDNLATIERTIYIASVDAEDVSSIRAVTFEIDEDAFTAIGINPSNIMFDFKVGFSLPSLGEELPETWWPETGCNLVRFTNKDSEDYGNLYDVNMLAEDGMFSMIEPFSTPVLGLSKVYVVDIRFYRPFGFNWYCGKVIYGIDAEV